MEPYESIVNEVARMEDQDTFIEKCCLLVAMAQPGEVDEGIIRDIWKINYDRANEPSREEKGTQFSFTMEDRCKPETSCDLLEDLSMNASIGTTDSGVEKHVAKMLDATCDPSRLNMPSQSSVTAGLRMDSLRIDFNVPDAQDIQDETKCSILPSQSDACVGSPSSDLMDSKVGCSYESIFRYIFVILFKKHQGEDGIWSTFVDRLYYLQWITSGPIQIQEANLTTAAKQNLFDAANNNIPNNIPKQNYRIT